MTAPYAFTRKAAEYIVGHLTPRTFQVLRGLPLRESDARDWDAHLEAAMRETLIRALAGELEGGWR